MYAWAGTNHFLIDCNNNNNNNNNPICKAPECQKTSVALKMKKSLSQMLALGNSHNELMAQEQK